MSPAFLRRAARGPVAAALLVALALVVAACGGSNSSNSSASSSKAGDPIKIGVLLPYTGPFGLYGKPMEAALRARFAQVHDKVAGHPIQLTFLDEQTDAKTAVTEATKLVESNHARVTDR